MLSKKCNMNNMKNAYIFRKVMNGVEERMSKMDVCEDEKVRSLGRVIPKSLIINTGCASAEW